MMVSVGLRSHEEGDRREERDEEDDGGGAGEAGEPPRDPHRLVGDEGRALRPPDLLVADRLEALLQHLDELGLRPLHLAQLDDLVGEVGQVAAPHGERDLLEVDAVEDDRVALLVLVDVLDEVQRHLGPVDPRVDVVGDVVAVVEREHVEGRVHVVARQRVVGRGQPPELEIEQVVRVIFLTCLQQFPIKKTNLILHRLQKHLK